MVSRRSLLRGRFKTSSTPIRPPWSQPEAEFIHRCDRCDRCVSICPTHIIKRGQGGFPMINFEQGECLFCGDCLSACHTGALVKQNIDIDDGVNEAWDHRVSISDCCITNQGVVCRSCSDCCVDQAITFHPTVGGISHPIVAVEQCNGCGACVGVCPTRAISMKRSVPNVASSQGKEYALTAS